jgi:hypothetical protein
MFRDPKVNVDHPVRMDLQEEMVALDLPLVITLI